jgi:hypothetical protein
MKTKDDQHATVDFGTNAETFASSFNDMFSRERKTLNITNCPSTADASEFISNDDVRAAITGFFTHLIAVRIEVAGDFNPEHAEKPKKHEFNSKETFVVAFESCDGKSMVIYWKNTGSSDFLGLKLVDDEITADGKAFILEFIIEAVSEGQSGESSAQAKARNDIN